MLTGIEIFRKNICYLVHERQTDGTSKLQTRCSLDQRFFVKIIICLFSIAAAKIKFFLKPSRITDTRNQRVLTNVKRLSLPKFKVSPKLCMNSNTMRRLANSSPVSSSPGTRPISGKGLNNNQVIIQGYKYKTLYDKLIPPELYTNENYYCIPQVDKHI